MPLDIFVPFWGDPRMLRETVHSVLAQDNADWLLTVVDDAYPDESVSEFFATLDDPRVTYVRNAVNRGITENYRTCVQLATQDLVVILGCDDVLLPNYVDVVLAAHRAFPGASVIQPGVQIIDEEGAVVVTLADTIKQRVVMPSTSSPTLLSGEELAVSLLRADWLYWPSLAFRRDVLLATPFRDGMPIIQDLALVMDVVCAGGSLLLEPTLCFSYRRHSASASSAKAMDGSRFRGERAYFDLAAEQVGALGWRRARRAARWHITSRLHALTLLPRAVVSGRKGATTVLLNHAFRSGTAA
ncbi:glycosyltransferase family 2 protein [Cellulomonas chengniuliangii]|uniref:Glycosyltransferase n=1 Tax=Cellulomonas chengniuliangii TaxID=2968084 RepID=A0ABY5KVP4_9CELL|nr:glycosyltransferase [Cellulomonas chengniuliangii]MCC2308740.1 glycosyltransferase [Cellulomonas chengniuliangii]UUI74509.1 glycosyltransferase [Cellulomonas chengniuliangii]